MENKLALIIGGSGGVGIEAARVLSDVGIKVYLSYFSSDKIKQKVKEFNIDAQIRKIDIKDEKNVNDSISSILNEHKKIDIVVYCVSGPLIYKKVQDLSWQDLQDHIDVQVKGFFVLVKALWRQIQAKYKIKFIVVLSDSCIGKPPAMLSHYVTAKYGLLGLVKSLASELTAYNCTFNMVSPGMVKTDLLSNVPHKLIEMTASANPMKRIADPSDVAKVIYFLASDNSDYLNGVNIPVNGGNIFL